MSKGNCTAELQKTPLQAGKQVSDTHQNYTSTTKVIDIQQKQVEALKLTTDCSKQLLKSGLANYLEVLTTHQQALNVQLNLADSRYRQFLFMVNSYPAMGGGWQGEKIAFPIYTPIVREKSAGWVKQHIKNAIRLDDTFL